MNCPFCHQEMYFDGYALGRFGETENFTCGTIACLVNQDWPRYKCQIAHGLMVQQEYALGDFYVKVYDEYSLIYQVRACMLFDQVKIARQLWLNPTNFEQTLDKLKLLVIFS